MPRPWTAHSIPNQSGRTIVITGANTGLGFECARALASRHACLILACRNLIKGGGARRRILDETPDATVEVMPLDLADLGSIRAFAETFLASGRPLHVLVNSAGVMATPRQTTADGFELQFGTNHLGHFALTGLRLERLLATPSSRVVTVTSLAEGYGRIPFDDLAGERFYERWLAYCNSKLANVLFAYELQRRFEAAGASAISVVAHPGFAATELRADLRTRERSLLHRILGHVFEAMSQSAAMGALPQLMAATADGVRGGEYYGPRGLFQRAGHPKRARSSRRSRDPRQARRLWDVSEELTGVTCDFTERRA